ncbi:MAG: hypothetical protein HWD85_04640 [Flavobacteriaceae bacterium]|nr:hypothetical protein [Flavobacteriaceae bacterium]
MRKLIIILLTTLLFSCSKQGQFDKKKETEEILKLHNLQRDYHFNKDSISFVNQLSENFISVNKGVITRPERSEILNRYNSYFSSVEFLKWDDVTKPIIKFSEDGTLAYSIVDKIVKVIYKNEIGENVYGETHFAWTAIYKKYDDKWRIECVTSTEKPNSIGEKDFIITEKDIIPEGTAYNSKTSTIYIGSIYKQKVIAISPNGNINDIITQEVFENLSPIGMEVDNKNNILWTNVALAPIVNKTGKNKWKTTIMSFDLTTNKLIKKYDFIEGNQVFLNDLTIDKNGDVYATESVNSNIYKLNTRTDKLAIYLDLKKFGFPNGIVYNQPQHCLFIATNEGIVKIDIETKKAKLLEVEENINVKVIDGLAINNDYFIGHQSSKISKFYFDENMERIIRSEIFDSGDEFDSSTTGEVGNGFYHYIVNSQIRSGINRKKNQLKPLDSLENVIIRTRILK